MNRRAHAQEQHVMRLEAKERRRRQRHAANLAEAETRRPIREVLAKFANENGRDKVWYAAQAELLEYAPQIEDVRTDLKAEAERLFKRGGA